MNTAAIIVAVILAACIYGWANILARHKVKVAAMQAANMPPQKSPYMKVTRERDSTPQATPATATAATAAAAAEEENHDIYLVPPEVEGDYTALDLEDLGADIHTYEPT